MCRMNNENKQNMLDILVKPDISIECCDYTEYLGAGVKYYKVMNLHSVPLIELSVTPARFGMERYEVCEVISQKKYSRLVRKNAIFHTPMADDIMDIYNWLKLRYLPQQTKSKKKGDN